MSQDDSQDLTPHFRSDTPTRSRGLLRRLMQGLRGVAAASRFPTA